MPENITPLVLVSFAVLLLLILVVSFRSRAVVFCQYLRAMTGIQLQPKVVGRVFKESGKDGVRQLFLDLIIREELKEGPLQIPDNTSAGGGFMWRRHSCLRAARSAALIHRLPLPWRPVAFGDAQAGVPAPHKRVDSVNVVSSRLLLACDDLWPLACFYSASQTLLVCVYLSSASRPWSRPKPDSLKPPKGSAGS